MVALPDGRYTVSFTLAGFTTVVRTNVEVLANFTATVNADMAVGGLNETITVSGEAPVVDVQSASQSRALDRGSVRDHSDREVVCEHGGADSLGRLQWPA